MNLSSSFERDMEKRLHRMYTNENPDYVWPMSWTISVDGKVTQIRIAAGEIQIIKFSSKISSSLWLIFISWIKEIVLYLELKK